MSILCVGSVALDSVETPFGKAERVVETLVVLTVDPTYLSAALDIAAKINQKSPTANRMAKFALNLIDDGLVGQQVFAGEATRLIYMTDEAEEGRDAFLEKRAPDWTQFPYHF